MEKVSRGLYIMDDVWLDELFILQQRNGAIIYSGETALYLHGLTDREYSSVSMDFGGFKKNSPMNFQNVERSPMDFKG